MLSSLKFQHSRSLFIANPDDISLYIDVGEHIYLEPERVIVIRSQYSNIFIEQAVPGVVRLEASNPEYQSLLPTYMDERLLMTDVFTPYFTDAEHWVGMLDNAYIKLKSNGKLGETPQSVDRGRDLPGTYN